MKGSRFSEGHIIGLLREHEAKGKFHVLVYGELSSRSEVTEVRSEDLKTPTSSFCRLYESTVRFCAKFVGPECTSLNPYFRLSSRSHQ